MFITFDPVEVCIFGDYCKDLIVTPPVTAISQSFEAAS